MRHHNLLPLLLVVWGFGYVPARALGQGLAAAVHDRRERRGRSAPPVAR